MPRFVILQHESPSGRHFDFMLEMGGSLKTWSLPQPPLPSLEINAEKLPDHRLAYLDYEGPISGERGSVACWDRGTYDIQCQTERELTVRLTGEKLIGKATLAQSSEKGKVWVFSFT